ncbi:hypothetical protein TRAPUB_13040 [Trametes pubescens]|uniref:Uncharacterized protein n=1 Tax=Trametes pubescens TaxID=154538 RepID=A0A1M2VS68_TRAPU|nr:hypothetical protein TRAPUB_13040 [Trametes pubescens]
MNLVAPRPPGLGRLVPSSRHAPRSPPPATPGSPSNNRLAVSGSHRLFFGSWAARSRGVFAIVRRFW